MLTARNEFETIEAFTSIAGDSLGTWSDRETTAAMLEAVDTVTARDTHKLWVELARCTDDDPNNMWEIQRDAADLLNEFAPLPPYCVIDLTNSEWRVSPYLDDELERFEDTPEDYQGDDVLIVNDHGNVTLMHWNAADREYESVWSMV